MGLYEEIASRSFKETKRGETIFFFPVFPFVADRGHVVPTFEDAQRLRVHLSKFHMISTWIWVPIVAFCSVSSFCRENFAIVLSAIVFSGLILRVVYVFFLRKLVRGYRRTEKKIGFLEAQRMQADGYSEKSIRNSIWLDACFIGLGIVALIWGEIMIGLVMLVVFGLFGLHFMHLARIKRHSTGSMHRDQPPEGAHGR